MQHSDDRNGQNSELFAQPEQYPMKWHKFLIYFSLWVGALVTLSAAGQLFSGSHYNGLADAVYAMYGSSLKTLDLLMGIASIFLAVWAIYTRFQLARYKSGAPAKLMLLYALSLIVSLLYMICACSISGISFSVLLEDNVGTLIGSVLMMFINKVYYDKRSVLFVN